MVLDPITSSLEAGKEHRMVPKYEQFIGCKIDPVFLNVSLPAVVEPIANLDLSSKWNNFENSEVVENVQKYVRLTIRYLPGKKSSVVGFQLTVAYTSGSGQLLQFLSNTLQCTSLQKTGNLLGTLCGIQNDVGNHRVRSGWITAWRLRNYRFEASKALIRHTFAV